MLRKIILSAFIIAALILVVPNKAQAAYSDGAAVGAALISGYPGYASLGVTGQFNGVPVMFGLTGRFSFGSGYGYFGLGLTADWWGYTQNLGRAGDSDVWFYVGPGGALALDFGRNYWNISIGFRVPIGFSFIIQRNWEIFLELDPSIGVLGFGSYGAQIFGLYVGNNRSGWALGGFLGFGGQFGFRYWF